MYFSNRRLVVAVALLSSVVGIIRTVSGAVAPCVADTAVRGDLAIRMNDNYGKDYEMLLGASRGGYGAEGSADAMRSLLKFDGVSVGISPGVQSATLTITVSGVLPPLPLPYTIEVHRILEAWDEGNGGGAGAQVDAAYGVSWAGIDANNQAQPPIDSAVAAVQSLAAAPAPGQVLTFDVTLLVQSWAAGTPNFGLELISPSSNGLFYQMGLVSREGAGTQYPSMSPPQIDIVLAPEPAMILCVVPLLTMRSNRR